MATDIDSPRLTAEDCGRAVDKLNAANSLVEEVAETLNSLEGGAVPGVTELLNDAVSDIATAALTLAIARNRAVEQEGGAR